jgi:hypothetical protein
MSERNVFIAPGSKEHINASILARALLKTG